MPARLPTPTETAAQTAALPRRQEFIQLVCNDGFKETGNPNLAEKIDFPALARSKEASYYSILTIGEVSVLDVLPDNSVLWFAPN